MTAINKEKFTLSWVSFFDIVDRNRNAAILLHKLYFYWFINRNNPKRKDGEFYNSRAKLSEGTTLSSKEQRTALTLLKKKDFVTTYRKGMHQTLWYKVNYAKLNPMLGVDYKIEKVENTSVMDDNISYKEYMESNTWKKLRKKVFSRSGGKCEMCGAKAENVHHVQYPKHFKDDTIENLVAVCGKCHQLCHGIRE